MKNPIDEIMAIDLEPYRKARSLGHSADRQQRQAGEDLDEASRKAIQRLQSRAAKIVAPHFIEWRDGSRGLSINHTDWNVRPHLTGEILPHNKGVYTKWARATITFSITGKTLEEYDAVFRGLKRAADELAAMLYTKDRGDD